MSKPEQAEFFRCRCGNLEHLLHLSYWPGDGPDLDLYVQMNLTTWKNPLRRLWVAFKYVFGYRSRYGAWDEICLRVEDAEHLIRFLDGFVREAESNVEA